MFDRGYLPGTSCSQNIWIISKLYRLHTNKSFLQLKVLQLKQLLL